MTAQPVPCGIDEAGLGSWAGPVCAAAVVLDPGRSIRGLDDSKRLSPERRQAARVLIDRFALAVGIGWAEPSEIDRIGLARANCRAMERAMTFVTGALADMSLIALIDGRPSAHGPHLPCPKRCIVGGDGIEPCISAASIVAKTSRDAVMIELDVRYPGYGLARNKGYGVAAHAEALCDQGPSPIHRMTFRPVADSIPAISAHALPPVK